MSQLNQIFVITDTNKSEAQETPKKEYQKLTKLDIFFLITSKKIKNMKTLILNNQTEIHKRGRFGQKIR